MSRHLSRIASPAVRPLVDYRNVLLDAEQRTVRFARPDATPLYAQVVTDQAGDAEMKIEMDESSLPDSSVLVQASYSGRTATRKFQLKKVEA